MARTSSAVSPKKRATSACTCQRGAMSTAAAADGGGRGTPPIDHGRHRREWRPWRPAEVTHLPPRRATAVCGLRRLASLPWRRFLPAPIQYTVTTARNCSARSCSLHNTCVSRASGTHTWLERVRSSNHSKNKKNRAALLLLLRLAAAMRHPWSLPAADPPTWARDRTPHRDHGDSGALGGSAQEQTKKTASLAELCSCVPTFATTLELLQQPKQAPS